ncbi:MAG TPA: PaaI family thioesterase [Edaphocola sp.]|nr:PaaI family thioesterase [Edaphocola sp.]
MKGGYHLLQQNLGKTLDNTPSPAGSWLGFNLNKVEPGKAWLTLEIRHEMCNPYGNIHGGMMSMVIDEAIGFAIISLDLETHYTSVNLNVDFLYAIKKGEILRAESEIIRYGKKIMNAEVKVYNDETNILLAKASSNLTATSMYLHKMS